MRFRTRRDDDWDRHWQRLREWEEQGKTLRKQCPHCGRVWQQGDEGAPTAEVYCTSCERRIR